MKKSRVYLIILSLLLIVTTLFNFTGCTVKASAEDLTEGITPNQNIAKLNDLSSGNRKVADFAVRLFKESQKDGENTLISPLSVLYALSMTANGAEKETLTELEAVLGMKTQELNPYLYTYMKNLPQGDKYKLNLANSIWFTEDKRFTVNKDFLQTNADYYNSEIYKAPFNNQTLKDINNWVNRKTHKMIPEILDAISPDAIMYLANAVAFEAEWDIKYEKSQIQNGDFTKADGKTQEVDFMHSSEIIYLEDENAQGFIKPYKDKKYAFAAILPNEDLTLGDYIKTLNGDKLYALLNSPKMTEVKVSIPKFESEYFTEMSEVLSNMGMSRAFNPPLGQFGGIGTSTGGNIYIDRVLHKTFISVDENGTKAAAVTLIETKDNFSMPTKTIHLNRPFLYMLIDTENNIPFFIGTVNEIN